MLTATADKAQVAWVGGYAITLTATGWPTAALTARFTGAAGTHTACISARIGQQQVFFALGPTLQVYSPQLPAQAQAYTLEVLDDTSTVIAQVPIYVGPPQYGSGTFALRSLLPVNYATGAKSLGSIDQEGY